MKIHPFLAACFMLGLGLSSCAEKTPPNILLIVADDMNEYGFLHTHSQVLTPSLDAFREEAITFPQSYCAAPACSPSRTAFLSGVSPHRSGKYHNGCDAWNTPLLEAQESMMEWFLRAGYNTYGKGKLFHSRISDERAGRNFMGDRGKGGFGPFPDSAHRTFGSDSRFRGVQAFPEEDFPDVMNARSVIELLEADHEKPFFIMYGLWRPHSPYTCPQRFLDMYDPADITIPAGYLEADLADLPPIPRTFIEMGDQKEFRQITSTKEQWKKYLRGYFACYTFADFNIGRVIEALDKSAYAENTIVIVTSDNGFHMGEKDRFNKNGLWEQSAITPMAVRVPGSSHAGETCPAPVNLQDLYPTFVDLCGDGLEPLAPVDGHSFSRLLENPDAQWENPSISYFGKGWVSVRSEHYRYLVYPDGSCELYDHRSDPKEWSNLAGDPAYEEIRKELEKHVPAEMAETLEGRWSKALDAVLDKVASSK